MRGQRHGVASISSYPRVVERQGGAQEKSKEPPVYAKCFIHVVALNSCSGSWRCRYLHYLHFIVKKLREGEGFISRSLSGPEGQNWDLEQACLLLQPQWFLVPHRL